MKISNTHTHTDTIKKKLFESMNLSMDLITNRPEKIQNRFFSLIHDKDFRFCF